MYIKKTNDPQGWVNFDPRAINWTTSVKVHKTMHHAKYLSSSPCRFGEEDFLGFHYMYKETNDHPGRDNFDPWAIIWTNFVEVH